MENKTNKKRDRVLDSYILAICKHTAGEITDEQFIKIRNNVAAFFVA